MAGDDLELARVDMEAAEPDECHRVLRRHFVQEWKVLEALIQAMVSSNGDVPMQDIKKAQLIMEKYQEQGQLLEPHLEKMVCPLMDILRSQANNGENLRMDIVKKLCSIIHTLVTVCGYKTVVKFFPHLASDLELAVRLLEICHAEVEETSILREESTGQWETKCCLLLWLSILVLIPFDMASVDTSLAEANATFVIEIPPLIQRMLVMCKDYLASPGPMREMAGVLLSRLLTRPDMRVALRSFMVWTLEAISSALNNSTADFLVPGLIGAVAAIFKVGGYDILVEVTPLAWEEANQLATSSLAFRSLLLRKFLVKLIQRIGLVYLRPRMISWRYQSADSIIAENLSLAPHENLNQAFIAGRGTFKSANIQLDYRTEDDTFDVPEVVEEIIEHLLIGLKDKDTVVRWSAAKGIGRITARLTSSLADDVVASVLELLRSVEGDGAWHGGCLALAELSRRGLLLPSRLRQVVPLVIEALHYDVRRGSHSIGAHVRDAAAYVCWAFARAYSPALMHEHLEKLAPVLLSIACYDREVNCRRAASAAFQENVGRQGNYPHGIDLVNATDYFSVASRSTSYCSVAVYVAQFSEYQTILVGELIQRKLSHWDRSVRDLAAEALGLLVKYEPAYFEGHVLDILLPSVLSTDLNVRHGATLAIAEVILALKHNGCKFCQVKEKALAGIVPSIEKARLYRGKGGEIMRAAVSRLVECESLVQIPLSVKVQLAILDTIHENLRHPNGQIQDCAVAAFRAFVQTYMIPADPKHIEGVTMKHLKIVCQDLNAAAKRGSALALGALPRSFLLPVWKDVMDGLCSACAIEINPEQRDAETRVNAVRGLVSVCKTLLEYGDSESAQSWTGASSIIETIKTQVLECLFKALDDYAVDNRGDVGSWVREAAIVGLEEIVVLVCKVMTLHENISSNEMGITDGQALINDEHNQNLVPGGKGSTDPFDAGICRRLVGSLVKQALEKINRVRDTAWTSLCNILHNESIPVSCIPHREQLQRLIPNDKEINWGAPDNAFPQLVRVLEFPEFRMDAMSGLVISIGGLGDSLAKVALSSFLDFWQSCENAAASEKTINTTVCHGSGINASNWLGSLLVLILQMYAGNDRVIIPTFKTIDILFSKGVFVNYQRMEMDLALKILEVVRLELRKTKDVVKIMAGANVLGHLALMPDFVGHRAVSQLVRLLRHRYPKVRKVCAELLYLVLIQRGEDLIPSDHTAAQDVLGDTCWDGSLESIMEEVHFLAKLLNVEYEFEASMEPQAPPKQSTKPVTCDENASYAALISDSR